MNEEDLKQMGKRLRNALGPLKNAELERDLWPEMVRKLDQTTVHVPWFDWVLLAGLGVALWFFPALLQALLYHI